MYGDKTRNDRDVRSGGFIRKQSTHDPNELEALFTVGRLIREDRLLAFSYEELQIESRRRFPDEMTFNALAGCKMQTCAAALERSRFVKTTDFVGYMAKGGKKDLKAGKNTSISQITFVNWLLSLTDGFVEQLIFWRETIGLSEFEVDSLRHLSWFRLMCQVAGKAEHYPDILHLWTAQRNRMDAFLTLDADLAKIAKRFPKGGRDSAGHETAILHPLELLARLGIETPDAIPIKHGYFYSITGQVIRLPEERT
jgi:hypothetical protein